MSYNLVGATRNSSGCFKMRTSPCTQVLPLQLGLAGSSIVASVYCGQVALVDEIVERLKRIEEQSEI